MDQRQTLPIQAQRVANAPLAFGFDLLSRCEAEKPDENVLISPFCIAQALAIAYNGAGGETKAQMEAALGFSGLTREEVNEGLRSLNGSLASCDPAVEIAVANALWVKAGLAFAPDFQERCQTYLDAEASGGMTADAINGWVKQKTRGHIERIVNAQQVQSSVSILTNAVYFQGSWSEPFDPADTCDKDFACADGTVVTVAAMHKRKSLPYFETDLLQAAALDYGAGRLRMVIVLPKPGRALRQIVAALDPETWSQWMLRLSTQEIVSLSLPKLNIQYANAEIARYLTKMGMDKATAPQADFRGLGLGDLFISDVVHRTSLDVDEKGTIASAATAVLFGRSMPAMPIQMTVNRPFFCAIHDKESGAILFSALIQNPSKP